MRPLEEPTRQKGLLSTIFLKQRVQIDASLLRVATAKPPFANKYFLRRTGLENLTMYVHRANYNNWNAAGDS